MKQRLGLSELLVIEGFLSHFPTTMVPTLHPTPIFHCLQNTAKWGLST